MDYRKAAAAAGAGICGAVLALAATLIALYVVLVDFASSEPTPVYYPFLLFGAAPVLALAGGSLVAWKLGVKWWLSPFFSLGSHVVGILLWTLAYALLARTLLNESLISLFLPFATVYVFVVPLIVVPATYYGGTPLNKGSMLTLTLVSVVLLLVTLLSANAVVTLATGVLVWPALTALATLLQTQRDNDGAD